MPETCDLTYGRAINEALGRALTERNDTLVYGEDVGRPGGVFGATRGLRSKFGDRVFDTPISEAAILGSAIGAAMVGRRPIVEIMWADFSLVALDQIVNQAANIRYVSNGQLTAPLTIRTQQGVAPGSCAQHSQSLEAIFAHTPGIRVAMPATAQDAYDLLLAAVWCDDPSIVIENRNLYFGDTEAVAVDGAVPAVGGARSHREGGDITLLSWGAAVGTALEAADQLAAEDIHAQVIDLRWLNPIDDELIVESVRNTGHALVVHEANVTGGFGAEIAARITEAAFDVLLAPIGRIGVPDARMPAAPHLQAAILPSPQVVAERARQLIENGRLTRHHRRET